MNPYVKVLWSLLQQDPAAKTAYELLSQAGGQVYVVGGAVRDVVLGKRPKDLDLMVAGLTQEQIENALRGHGRVELTGKQFAVYRFRRGTGDVEIAMPRTERSTGGGHKDFEVTVDPFLPVEEDLGRRDFTSNAMAASFETDSIIDPFGGQEDIEDGVLQLVNDNAFQDDPLRIVRALVALAVNGLEPTEELVESMRQNAGAIRNLPAERIQEELDKLLSGTDPTSALRLADDSDVLDYMLPELAATMGFDQKNEWHDLDVGEHSLAVLQAMSEISNDSDLRLAALLHDLGKPDSFWTDDEGRGHFYQNKENGELQGQDHELVGAEIASQFMTRTRYPNDRRSRVVTLVKHHMFPYFYSLKGARRFLASLGGDVHMAFDLFKLREADARGKKDGTMSEYDQRSIEVGIALIQQVLDEESALTKKDLAINGSDLIARGMQPGPEIGAILDELLNVIIENPEVNNREELLRLSDGLRKSYG